MFQTGRRFANRSSALRSPTLTLVNPPPTGVVTGPLSATLLRLIDSSSSSGSVVPCAFQRQHAGAELLPFDLEPGAFEDRDHGAGDFRADAVAGNERNACVFTCFSASRAARPRAAARSRWPNAAFLSLSMSISPSTSLAAHDRARRFPTASRGCTPGIADRCSRRRRRSWLSASPPRRRSRVRAGCACAATVCRGTGRAPARRRSSR